jgi:hypothetical protein
MSRAFVAHFVSGAFTAARDDRRAEHAEPLLATCRRLIVEVVRYQME